jgi:Dynamin family
MNNLVEEIKKNLTDATDEQVNRFATQVERLGKIETFFKKFNDERGQFDDLLNRARKALNYTKPYRIAVIGTIGAGKSTLINALLGRDLVLTKAIGKPATGAALEIFLDVPQRGAEKAIVTYRDGRDIGNLVKEFIDRYQLDGSSLKGKLDASFASNLSRLNSNDTFSSQQQQNEFIELRKTLADIIIQYANNTSKQLKTEFSLENYGDREYLMELIDEHSFLNNENSTNRLIGLVKTVSYHIQTDSSFGTSPSLSLPGNVA